MQAFSELSTWLATLDATFAFLVALPFAIGALGLAAVALGRDRVDRPRAAAARRPERAAGHAHVQ